MKKIVIECCQDCDLEAFGCNATIENCPLPDDRTEELEAEVARLKAWKESALSVMPDFQRIGKLLGVRLGGSVHDKIVPSIERMVELEAENKRLREVLEGIASEFTLDGEMARVFKDAAVEALGKEQHGNL